MTPMIPRMFGIDETETSRFMARVEQTVGVETLIGRAGNASDIANAALFLASDLSSWISGVGLTVDGGATAFTKDATVGLITEIAGEFA
jgi:NAD(P)-dependent dehydrogenase (short-subunit alcohol dehydrogenase family)